MSYHRYASHNQQKPNEADEERIRERLGVEPDQDFDRDLITDEFARELRAHNAITASGSVQ